MNLLTSLEDLDEGELSKRAMEEEEENGRGGKEKEVGKVCSVKGEAVTNAKSIMFVCH